MRGARLAQRKTVQRLGLSSVNQTGKIKKGEHLLHASDEVARWGFDR